MKSCLYTGTVQHRRHEPVSNVFKYYIAYKLSIERTEEREAAKKEPV